MLTWTAASLRHHRLLFLGALLTIFAGASLTGACVQLVITALGAPDEGLDVVVTGSGTLDGEGRPGTAVEHYSPLGSGREDLLAAAGTIGAVCLLLTATTLSATVGCLVAARTQELGTLRLLGARAPALRTVLVAETAALALVASAAGALVSVVLTGPMLEALRAGGFVAAAFEPRSSLLGTGLTVAAAVGVAVLGARRGSRRALDIRPGLAGRGLLPPHGLSRRRRTAALLGAAGVLAAGALAVRSGGDGAVGLGLMLPMLFGGCAALLAPVLVPRTVSLLARLVRRAPAGGPGAAAELGASFAAASREAATAVALPALLFVGIAGGVVSAVGADVSAADAATRDQVRASVVVTEVPGEFPAEAARRLGAKTVDAPLAHTVVATDRDTAIELSAEGVDPAALLRTRGVAVSAGDLSGLTRGGVAVSRQEADDDGYRVGQTLSFVTQDRRRHTLPIVAIVDGSPGLVPQVMLGRDWTRRNVPQARAARAFLGDMDTRGPEELASRLNGMAGAGRAVPVGEWADETVRASALEGLGGVGIVLVPAGAFAALGTANAVLMWLSTQREVLRGLERIGAAAGQRRTALAWWAVITAGTGCLLGGLIAGATDAVVRLGLFGSLLAHPGAERLLGGVGASVLVMASALAPVLWWSAASARRQS